MNAHSSLLSLVGNLEHMGTLSLHDCIKEQHLLPQMIVVKSVVQCTNTKSDTTIKISACVTGSHVQWTILALRSP
jgi:hypothetical protein